MESEREMERPSQTDEEGGEDVYPLDRYVGPACWWKWEATVEGGGGGGGGK